MPTLRFPIKLLQEEVATKLASWGDSVPHAFGAREVESLTTPPTYVWLPSRTKENRPTSQHGPTLPRSIMSVGEFFEVHIWGPDYETAYGMRQNVIRALKHVAGTALRIENGEWMAPSASWNQEGEVFVLEASLSVSVFDQYVELTNKTYSAENTVTPTEIQGDVRITDSLDTEGESVVTTSTS